MKNTFTIIRIATILFEGYLYFGLKFDLLSCIISTFLVFAITISFKQKKSEAATSDS